MDDRRDPKRDHEGNLACFVMQRPPGEPPAWPSAQQVQQVQGTLGDAVRIDFRTTFVEGVCRKADHAHAHHDRGVDLYGNDVTDPVDRD